MLSALLLTIAILIALVVGWHVLFIVLGGIIVITATAWIFIVVSILAFCIAILLGLVFTGVGAFVLSLLVLAWTILAIVLFPILFPILIPLFVIFMFISYWRRKQSKEHGDKK